MTTSLDQSHRIDLKGNAIQATDLDLSGNLSVTGSMTSTNNIVNNTASAGTTLTQAQSGSTIIMTNLAGNTFTLPASVVGTTYRFVVGLVNTSNAYKVITPASVFICGSATINIPAVVSFTGAESFAAVSTTTRSVNLNGTTSGGLTIGDSFRLTCISSTLWMISDANLTGSVTVVTPFANS